MNARRCLAAIICAVVILPVLPAVGQTVPTAVRQRIGTLVAGAYQEAAEAFPCKVKTRGKPRMLRWQDVDKCVNNAATGVSWEKLSSDLQTVRSEAGIRSLPEFLAAVQAAFDAQAIPFQSVLTVKAKDAYLPLTNSVLRFLPETSLQQAPVIEKSGTEVGKFGGIYQYERTGGLSTSNSFKLTLFQYTDRRGNMTTASDKLLLDSYGVPWSVAAPQRGFRLGVDKLQMRP